MRADLQEDGAPAIEQQVDIGEGGIQGIRVRAGQGGRQVSINVHLVA
jgi:hypothetical protein